MTGLLIFFILKNKLDIAFTTIVIYCLAKNLLCQYNKTDKTIMRYLKVTRLVEITYGRK